MFEEKNIYNRNVIKDIKSSSLLKKITFCFSTFDYIHMMKNKKLIIWIYSIQTDTDESRAA